MQDRQTVEVPQISRQAQEVSEAEGTDRMLSRYSLKGLKPYLDAIQRLVCLALAVWVMYHYNNLWEFITILAAGQIDPRGAQDLLVRVLKSLISEGK